jgi:predicted ABC-type ATPase
MKPVLIVIAGPNGAGKTTVTDRIRRDHWSDGVTYLNADEIARDKFGDWVESNPSGCSPRQQECRSTRSSKRSSC